MSEACSIYDVAVIGLGPAGAIFAGHIDKRLRVIALDKKKDDAESYRKPCGGLLAPDAQKSLSRFQLSLPKSVLVSPQIFSVRTIDLKSGVLRHYQRHYINLDRHAFDMWLIHQIPSHIDLRSDALCTGIKPTDGGYLVTFTQNGREETIRTRYLVGADGASSIVRRSVFKNEKGAPLRSYLSVQQWFPDKHETPFYSCVFDESLTDSYAWGLSKDGCFIFGGAFNVKTGMNDFERLKEKLGPFGFQLNDPIKTEACMVLRPKGMGGAFRDPRYVPGANGSGACLIGEAAGFISPSSMEGISYAIDSGCLLSECFAASPKDPLGAYHKRARAIRLKLLAKNLKRPFLYTPVTRRIIMKSGVTSIRTIGVNGFDA